MTATFPGSINMSFTTKTDLVDHVEAEDVNGLQDEVVAIETTLGANAQISTAPNPASTFAVTSITYANVAARLANIEIGVVSDAHIQYVRNTGGAVVTTTNNSVVPLTLTAKSGQTADILQVTGPAGTPVYLNVDHNGIIYNNSQALPLGRVTSGTYTNVSSAAGVGVELMLGSTLSVAFTFVSGRKYRASVVAVVGDGATTNSGGTLRLHNGTTAGSTVVASAPLTYIVAGVGTALNATFYLDNLAAGAHTITFGFLSNSGGANLQLLQSVSNPAYVWVEDIGT